MNQKRTQTPLGLDGTPRCLSFSSEMPTREGCYWLKCGENDGEAEWASVFRRKDGVMMCELDSLGTYGLMAIHENLCDVQWAPALTIIPDSMASNPMLAKNQYDWEYDIQIVTTAKPKKEKLEIKL